MHEEGTDPRVVVTTTPNPIKIIRELIADPTTVETARLQFFRDFFG